MTNLASCCPANQRRSRGSHDESGSYSSSGWLQGS